MTGPQTPGVAAAAPGVAAPGPVYAVRPGVRLAAAVMVPFWTVLPGMGLIDLQTMFVSGFYDDSVGLMVSWGVFFTVLVGLPFGWAAVRPAQTLPVVVLLGVCAACLALGAVLGLQWEPAVVAGLVVLTALPLLPAALRQARHERLRPGPRLTVLPRAGAGRRLGVRPWPVVLALLMTPFAWGYAADAFRTARTAPSPEAWRTNSVDHWPVQGSLAVAVVVLLLVMAVWPRALPVFRAVLSLALATMALCWAMHPDTVGSVDAPLLTAGTLLAAVLVALVDPVPGADRIPAEPQLTRSLP